MSISPLNNNTDETEVRQVNDRGTTPAGKSVQINLQQTIPQGSYRDTKNMALKEAKPRLVTAANKLSGSIIAGSSRKETGILKKIVNWLKEKFGPTPPINKIQEKLTAINNSVSNESMTVAKYYQGILSIANDVRDIVNSGELSADEVQQISSLLGEVLNEILEPKLLASLILEQGHNGTALADIRTSIDDIFDKSMTAYFDRKVKETPNIITQNEADILLSRASAEIDAIIANPDITQSERREKLENIRQDIYSKTGSRSIDLAKLDIALNNTYSNTKTKQENQATTIKALSTAIAFFQYNDLEMLRNITNEEETKNISNFSGDSQLELSRATNTPGLFFGKMQHIMKTYCEKYNISPEKIDDLMPKIREAFNAGDAEKLDDLMGQLAPKNPSYQFSTKIFSENIDKNKDKIADIAEDIGKIIDNASDEKQMSKELFAAMKNKGILDANDADTIELNLTHSLKAKRIKKDNNTESIEIELICTRQDEKTSKRIVDVLASVVIDGRDVALEPKTP